MSEAGNNLDTLLARLHEAQSPKAVTVHFYNATKREGGEDILRSSLSNGHDPLTVLDPATSTIAYLFILSARLSSSAIGNVHPNSIISFCQTFDVEQSRYAPDRITLLAKGISEMALHLRNPSFALEPLHQLITRYPPSISFLTTIHPIYLLACIENQNYSAALPIIEFPVTEIDKTLSDLEYIDGLQYFYFGGIIFAALKRYSEAEEFLETAISLPAQTPSAIQLDAYKKLTLIQLIHRGKTRSPPKYTNVSLTKQMKALNAYAVIVRNFPVIRGTITELVSKEAQYFQDEGNFGLIKLVIEHAPRWALKDLIKTYSSLSLDAIAREIDVDSEAAACKVILDMIQANQISATISTLDNSVTFNDEAVEEKAISASSMQSLLLQAQAAGAELSSLDSQLMGSRKLLEKALKEKDQNNSSSSGMGGQYLVDDDSEHWTMGSRTDALSFDG